MPNRVDDFAGSPSEYVSYLERTVTELRQHITCHEEAHTVKDLTSSQASSQPHNIPGRPVSRAANLQDLGASLQIVEFNPDSSVKKPRNDAPKWMGLSNNLVDETPKPQNWEAALQDRGILDLLAMGGAVQSLLDPALDAQIPSEQALLMDRGETDLLHRVKSYASATARRAKRVSVALTLVNFQTFLLLSCCAVLLESGVVSPQDVLDTVRIGIGTDATDKYCRRLLGTAKYLNKLIDTLQINGWGYRAGELLLAWNRTVPFYYPLACSPGASLEYLKSQLCTDEFVGDMESRRTCAPIFVPSIVHSIIDKRIDTARVSEILGYRNAQLLKIRKSAWRFAD